MKNTQTIAQQFNCTHEQVRAQFARNARQLRSMAEKAENTGKRVNKYTSAQLHTMADKMERSAK